MNEFDILKELEKLNDEVEPGFLCELQQQAPDELHSRIMKSIRQDNFSGDEQRVITEIKPRNRFNYRKYTSTTAAAALLIIAVIGGAQSLLKNPVTSDGISPKFTIMRTETAVLNKTTNKSKSTEVQGNLDKTPIVTSPKPNLPSKKDINLTKNVAPIITSSTTKANDKPIKEKANSTNNSTKVTSKATLKQSNTDSSNVVEDVIVQSKTNIVDTKDPTLGSSENSDIGGKKITDLLNTNKGFLFKDPTIAADNNTTVDPSDSNNVVKSGVANIDPANPTNIDPLSPDNSSMVAYDNLVNYEISLNMSQIYIIQFIKEKGAKISENVYKLSRTDYNTLNRLLEQNGISKNKTNDVIDQFVFIKITTY